MRWSCVIWIQYGTWNIKASTGVAVARVGSMAMTQIIASAKLTENYARSKPTHGARKP
jgi:hypothetical protein